MHHFLSSRTSPLLLVAVIFVLSVTVPRGQPAPPTVEAAPSWTTITFQDGVDGYAGTLDTTLVRDSAQPTGADATLQLGWQALGQDAARPLIAFDLTAVPMTATIVSAVLDLTVVTPDPQPITVTVQPLLRFWDEPSATWLEAFAGAAWQEPGAGATGVDRGPALEPALVLPGGSNELSADLTDLVSAWVANPANNFGVLLQAEGAAGVDIDVLLASRETADIPLRPRLTVTYASEPGEPTPTPTATDTPLPTETPTSSPTPNPTQTRIFQKDLAGFQGFFDATLSSSFPTTTFGGTSELSVNWITYFYPPQVEGNSLLRVDLWDLPADAVVESAELSLYLLERTAPQSATLRAYELLRHWSEAETTWTESFLDQPWSVPGAAGANLDRAPDPSAELNLDANSGWITIPLTSLVQNWVAQPDQNHGIVVEMTSEGYDNVEYKFASSNNFEAGVRPRLTVRYSVPGPWQTAVYQKGRNGYGQVSDATINRWQPNSPLGNDFTLNLSWRDDMNDPAEDQRALMRFWLDSVPAQAAVQHAELFLFIPPAANSRPVQLNAWRLLRHWSEQQATWLRANDNTLWALPGADGIDLDRLGQPDATTFFEQPEGWVALDVTALLQHQHARPNENFGFLLTIGGLNQRAASYEAYSSDFPDPSLRPLLRVRYVVDPTLPTLTPTPAPTYTPWQQVSLRQGQYGYTGASDAGITRWQPTVNRGTSGRLLLGWRDEAITPRQDQRALMRFDLGAVPPTAVISNAQLSLYVPFTTHPHPVRLSAYRLLRPWWEHQVTWNRTATNSTWAVPGAEGSDVDRLPDPDATTTFQQPLGWVSLDVTALVQYFVNYPQENFGFLLMIDGLAGQTVYYNIYSENYWQAERRPTLRFAYTLDPAFPSPTPTATRTATPTPTATSTPGIWRTAVLQQTTGGYAGTQDSQITVYAPTTNYGNDRNLDVRWSADRWPPSSDMKALLQFDLSPIPPGAVIGEATLDLYQLGRSNTTPLTLSVYQSLRFWRELGVTWQRTEQGPPNDLLWHVPGALGSNTDRPAEPLTQTVLSAANGWVSLDISDLVQLWVDQPYFNRGLILEGKSTSYYDTVLYYFASRNYTRDPGRRPRLTVHYSIDPSVPTATPSATPTATPRPTATATPTPMATPIIDPSATTVALQYGVRLYYGARDTWIGAANPTTNHRAEPFIKVGPTSQGNAARVLISYDLASIPANAEVLGAWLELHQNGRSNPTPLTVSVHQVRQQWTDGTATWLRPLSSQFWQFPGASGDQDRDPTVLDTQHLDQVAGWVRWDVSNAVRDWLAFPSANRGLLLVGEAAHNVQYQFDSSERVWNGSNPTGGRPRLVITYRLPPF